MGEPLSAAASIVGVVVPALHGTRILLDDLRNLKDAPKTVKRLTEDVQSIEGALQLLRGVDEKDWQSLGADVATHLKETIGSCTEACDIFRADLQQWTQHSTNSKLGWQDRAKVGFFKQGQIKAMSEQLRSCKLTIDSTTSIATLYSSVRNSRITEEIKKSISANQGTVRAGIETTDRQLVVLESRVEELNLSDDDKEGAETEDKVEALQQLEQQRKALDVSRRLLGALLSKAQEDAVAKAALDYAGGSTNVSFGNNYSGFQSGVVHGGVSGLTFGRK